MSSLKINTISTGSVSLSPGTNSNDITITLPNNNGTCLTIENGYYSQAQVLKYAATNGCLGSDIVFDSSGNLYWAVDHYYNGSTLSLTSYVYKITPNGTLSQFASTATTGARGTSLAVDSNDNLYWAVMNAYNGTTYNLTSYVYKITPGGSQSIFASVATNGGFASDLIFDNDGNLYWAVCNYYNGTTYNLTSYVYKITPGGSLTTFASAATSDCVNARLVFDNSGNLYWAVANQYNGTTRYLTSYVYKITPAGSLSTYASVATIGALGLGLVFDNDGNLYWGIGNQYDGTTWNLTSYVYKITPDGSLTTLASQQTFGAFSSDLLFENNNLYWSISNYYNGTIYNFNSYIYKINMNGQKTTLSTISTTGGNKMSLVFDNNKNLYCANAQYYNGSSYNLNSYVYKIPKITLNN